MKFPMRRVGEAPGQSYQRSVTWLGSASIDVERQFSVFSDGTPPLFYQAPHIADQSGQVILVDDDPLLFHAVFETGGIEALACLCLV
jgi:hypothetical protein